MLTKHLTHTFIGFYMLLIIVLLFYPISTLAQEVVVFDDFPPIPADVDKTMALGYGTNQHVLVIPVISQDTAFDPENNLLSNFDPTNPDLRNDLINKFQEVNDFWLENSYGEVTFNVEILERYYQMPRETDYYFNPGYVTPNLVGTPIEGPSIDIPSGQLRLVLHISDVDETTINIMFDAADSPYTFVQLETKISNDLSTIGDKLNTTFINCGADCRRMQFEVDQVYVVQGSYIHIDFSASDSEILDVLGLDRPVVDLSILRLNANGSELPYTSQAGDILTLTIENDIDPPETYTWTMAADTFNVLSDFIDTHGTAHAAVTMTTSAGELRVDVSPTISGPYTSMLFYGPTSLLDKLGLDASTEQDGTINISNRNTIKGDMREIAGQAIAAYMLNELTRSSGAPGPDPFPNTPIDAANEATLKTLFETEIDPVQIISIILLDAPPNKRPGARGGYLPVGIQNGDYRFVHVTSGHMQMQFDETSAGIIAHETGHNIGLPDHYNNSNGEYDPSLLYPVNWDIMCEAINKPHTGVWNKEIMNGWLGMTGAAIDLFPEPGTSGVSDTRRYVLTPLELAHRNYDTLLAGVPAGRSVVKAIRLPMGLGIAGNDHFLFVQNRQRGETYSQNLPQNPAVTDRGGVYITDTISWQSYDFFKPQARNFVHPLSDIPTLPTGDVTPVIDATPSVDFNFLQSYPAYDGLEVDIVGEIPGPAPFADRSSYLVDVTREQKDYLELGLTPWGNPPYESVDIWIEHGDKAILSDIPLAGNGERTRWATGYDPAANDGNPLNWIRAQITNSGTVDATDVQIRVRVNTPSGMGDSGTWAVLTLSEPVDIAAGESQILQVPWNPSVRAHTCVQVEVFRWISVLSDRNPWNNRTQENVTLFHPTPGRSWGTTPFSFEFANGKNFDMDVAFEPLNLPRGYSISLDKHFINVGAKSTVTINGTLQLDDTIIPPPTGLSESGFTFSFSSFPTTQKPSWDIFHIAAFIMGDEYQIPAGGITYVTIPSVKVDLDVDVKVDSNGNIVVTGSTTPPAPGATVEVEVRYPSGRYRWVTLTVAGDGSINTNIEPEEDGDVRVTVKIPPGQGVAPTNSGTDIVNTRDTTGISKKDYTLDIFLGGLITDKNLLLDSGREWGLRYRYWYPKLWSLEVELGTADTQSGPNDGMLTHAQIQLMKRMSLSHVYPFVLAGVGIANFNSRGTSDTSPLATLGIGYGFQWTPRLGMRLDLRYLWLDDLLSSGTTHNWQILWGATFDF